MHCVAGREAAPPDRPARPTRKSARQWPPVPDRRGRAPHPLRFGGWREGNQDEIPRMRHIELEAKLILSVRETWLSEIIVVEAQAVRSGIEDAAKNDPQEPSADNMAFAIHLETKPLRLLPFVQRENISERPNVPGRPSHTR
jgi:hypothetical protein